VVVIVSGSAVTMEAWRQRVGAILMAWYPGMEGGHALADVLVGDAEPGGRLPVAVPTDPSHLPFFDRDARAITYDRWWGQRLLDRDDHAAAFPLGFGVGYTTFELGDAWFDVDAATGAVEVTNSGERRGATVVQVYASRPDGDEATRRELIGFQRVVLDAGATERITIGCSLRPLAVRDPATRTWSTPSGEIRVEVGQHSGDPSAAVCIGTLR